MHCLFKTNFGYNFSVHMGELVYNPVIRKNATENPMRIRRIGESDVEMVMEELKRWKEGSTEVPEAIRKGAFGHFEFGFKHFIGMDSSLFVVSENPENGSLYGVSGASIDDTERAISGYSVRLGKVRTGSVLLSEKLKTIFAIPRISEVETQITSAKGYGLAEKFYFKIKPSTEPGVDNDIGVLTRPNYERLVNDHPEYFG
ncbi:MAG: hypothetical protein GTN38_01595 [Candidatus Aenigmarchaeota archaeon]|nr:hypothetical protein [Candidatus Aenigmarchaeota archaeon]